jgi:iron complex transport system ATP-binding protein
VTVDDTLTAVAAVVPYLRASTTTEGDHWYRCDALVNDPGVLSEVIARSTPGFGTEDLAVGASLFAQAYAFRVAGVALAAYALGLPVPDVALDATAVRIDKPRPTQVAHLAPGARTMNASELAEHLVAGHLVPFVSAVHAQYRVGERLLHGNVASSCAVAFRAVEGASPEGRDEIRARAEAFVAVTPAFEGLGAFSIQRAGDREGWYWDRTSCCLWFRTPAEHYCDNCSLIPADELVDRRCRELLETSA